ncbi:hypothetical protein ACIRFH_10325 [Streptomyces sp. NPDC093586]|uniref:hypothetical protein n=1 Tax=Streptomyces sp. NPDC093586 TaxID=3366042 RepID=UPI00381681BB
MNSLGDAQLRTWTLRLMDLLAADPQDQLVRLDGREPETGSVVAEAELLCRVCEELAEREAFPPRALAALRAVGRRLGAIDAGHRAGLWSDALTTDPTWDGVRALARRFLLTVPDDWRRTSPDTARRRGPRSAPPR